MKARLVKVIWDKIGFWAMVGLTLAEVEACLGMVILDIVFDNNTKNPSHSQNQAKGDKEAPKAAA